MNNNKKKIIFTASNTDPGDRQRFKIFNCRHDHSETNGLLIIVVVTSYLLLRFTSINGSYVVRRKKMRRKRAEKITVQLENNTNRV